jgi:hypothetical protein
MLPMDLWVHAIDMFSIPGVARLQAVNQYIRTCARESIRSRLCLRLHLDCPLVLTPPPTSSMMLQLSDDDDIITGLRRRQHHHPGSFTSASVPMNHDVCPAITLLLSCHASELRIITDITSSNMSAVDMMQPLSSIHRPAAIPSLKPELQRRAGALMKLIACQPHLRCVRLINEPLSFGMLSRILSPDHAQLRMLEGEYAMMGDIGWPSLSSNEKWSPSLTHLAIQRLPMNDHIADRLVSQCSSLQSLSLHAGGLSPSGLVRLLTGLPHLNELMIQSLALVSSQPLINESLYMPHLRYLHCPFELVPIPSLRVPSLYQLGHVDYPSQIRSVAELAMLLTHAPRLTHINAVVFVSIERVADWGHFIDDILKNSMTSRSDDPLPLSHLETIDLLFFHPIGVVELDLSRLVWPALLSLLTVAATRGGRNRLRSVRFKLGNICSSDMAGTSSWTTEWYGMMHNPSVTCGATLNKFTLLVRTFGGTSNIQHNFEWTPSRGLVTSSLPKPA